MAGSISIERNDASLSRSIVPSMRRRSGTPAVTMRSTNPGPPSLSRKRSSSPGARASMPTRPPSLLLRLCNEAAAAARCTLTMSVRASPWPPLRSCCSRAATTTFTEPSAASTMRSASRGAQFGSASTTSAPVIDRAVASKRAASTRSPTSRSSRGRKRPATITHRSSATSSIQWARRSTSLGASRWASSIDTGVPSPLAEPRSWSRSRSAVPPRQTSRATRRGPAQQPRLAEADRSLEETDARCRLGEQLGEQRFARQFHLPPR